MGKRSKKRKLKQKLARRAAGKHPARRPRKAGYFKNNFGEVVTPIELVFPIVRKKEDGSFEAVGTGFFIHPAGGFVTAKHCLFEKDQYVEDCYAIQSLGNGQHLVRKIQYFKPHPIADIGMGMLHGQIKDGKTHKEVLRTTLVIAKQKPAIEDKIRTLAFPRMRITPDQIGRFPCDQYAGRIVDFHQGGFSFLKSDCYQANMDMKSGASGGPVLMGNKIIGVNSVSYETALHEEPISFITPIDFLYDLELEDSDGVKITVKELMDQGFMPSAE